MYMITIDIDYLPGTGSRTNSGSKCLKSNCPLCK